MQDIRTKYIRYERKIIKDTAYSREFADAYGMHRKHADDDTGATFKHRGIAWTSIDQAIATTVTPYSSNVVNMVTPTAPEETEVEVERSVEEEELATTTTDHQVEKMTVPVDIKDDEKFWDFYSNFDKHKPNGKSRKEWYNETTDSYRYGRPSYPKHIIDRVCSIAKLDQHASNNNSNNDDDDNSSKNDTDEPNKRQRQRHKVSKILEIGCGPGTVTKSFVERGYDIIAMDPSKSNVAGAKEECQPYMNDHQNVEIVESTFEDWKIPTAKMKNTTTTSTDENDKEEETTATVTFDAVVCATSFHWIPAEIRYSKIAQCLGYNGNNNNEATTSSKNDGDDSSSSSLPSSLILLWAMPPHPTSETIRNEIRAIHDELNIDPVICDQYLYTTKEQSYEMFQKFHVLVNESNYFESPCEDFHIECIQSKYTISKYIALLNSLSPYIGLDPTLRRKIFTTIEERLSKMLAGDGDDKNEEEDTKTSGDEEIEFDVTHWYGSQVSFVKK